MFFLFYIYFRAISHHFPYSNKLDIWAEQVEMGLKTEKVQYPGGDGGVDL